MNNVECKNLIYERGICCKAKEKRENMKEELKKIWEAFLHDVKEHPLLDAAVALTGWAAVTMWGMNADLREVQTNGTNMDSRLSSVEQTLEDTGEEIQTLCANQAVFEERLNDLSGDFSEVFTVTLKENNISQVGMAYAEDDNMYEISLPVWESDDVIATDIENGTEYNAGFLEGKRLLIPLSYQEEDKEVYFLGQYNENYHWDGYCVTNSYNADGTLYGICESNFDDGKRLDYISFYQCGENEWIYANRQLIEGENVGVTINYYIDDNKEKNFTAANVQITDILYADSYIENEDKVITKYYTGNTVNNLFNDYTGNAYEVKYDKDGTVRMLYVGRFKDGYCNDSTGEAFSIVYSDEYNAYVCNTGRFSNGHAETHSTEPITADEISEIIKDYTFDCELNWKN